MILSAHQPVYLPGIIFFNKMVLSDKFVYLGHVQFSPQSWQQRNRIRIGNNEMLLTVPVLKSGLFGQSIDEVKIVDGFWRRKHLGSIIQGYRGTPFFEKYFPELEEAIQFQHDTLGSLNRATISLFRNWLEIETPILESYDYSTEGVKTGMLIKLANAAGASQYLSNIGAKAYIDEPLMLSHGVQHLWQNFSHPTYAQLGNLFIPNLSALDLMFNVGPKAIEIVRKCGFTSFEAI